MDDSDSSWTNLKTDVQRTLKMSVVVSSTPCPDLEDDDDDARAFHVVDLS